MLGYCVRPPGLCYHNEPFGFCGLSLCKKALQAVGEYIPQEVKICMCIFVRWLPFMERKAVLLFVFLYKSGDTGAECESEEA